MFGSFVSEFEKFVVSKLMREIPFTLDDLPQFSFPKVGLAVLAIQLVTRLVPSFTMQHSLFLLKEILQIGHKKDWM